MDNEEKQCWLASASPRRLELLNQIGITPTRVVSPDIDESVKVDEDPQALVTRLAVAKCRAVCDEHHPEQSTVVIAADTVVVVNGTVLGKPADQNEFLDMMAMLSGQTHSVWSGLCVRGWCDDDWHDRVLGVETRVTIAIGNEAQWRSYWHSAEPRDKAGGYAIQGRGALLVKAIEGSYSNVVGLPLYELSKALEDFGVNVWNHY